MADRIDVPEDKATYPRACTAPRTARYTPVEPPFRFVRRRVQRRRRTQEGRTNTAMRVACAAIPGSRAAHLQTTIAVGLQVSTHRAKVIVLQLSFPLRKFISLRMLPLTVMRSCVQCDLVTRCRLHQGMRALRLVTAESAAQLAP